MGDRGRSAWGVANAARGLPLVVAFCATAWLGGCAELEDALFPREPDPVVLTEPAAEPVLPPAPKPRPAARVARLPTPAERSQPPSSQSQPQPESPALEAVSPPEIKLVGMSRGEAAMLLGAPTEERDVAPAKIWKFAISECTVDVYFYLDVARNDFYALHYNAQDRNGIVTGEAADRCLQHIYSENRK